jgi:hypothetical protein
MTLRKAHGRAAELGRLTASECPPVDELPPATPAPTVRKDRDANGRFLPGNAVAQHSRAKAGPQGALLKLDAQADPQWKAARQWARRGARHRIAEMAKLHGGEIGSEVCALIVDSWEMRGDARYLAAMARATGDTDLSRAAATLLASARQAARDAWQMAALEAVERGKRKPGNPHAALLEAFGSPAKGAK